MHTDALLPLRKPENKTLSRSQVSSVGGLAVLPRGPGIVAAAAARLEAHLDDSTSWN